MKRIITLLQILFLCVFVGCGGYIAKMFYDKAQTEKEMDELRGMIQLQEEEYTTEIKDEMNIMQSEEAENKYDENGMLSRYSSLYARNNEMFGWLKIDGTVIDYPVMRNSAGNAYYLHRNFDKKYSYAGIPFADYQCSDTSENIIIYAHNMNNGTMFRSLLKYSSKDFWEKNMNISFDTLYNRYIYRIIAVFHTAVGAPDEFKYYEFTDSEDEVDFDIYVQECIKRSLYKTGETAHYGENLLTLSTCSYNRKNERFVVVAKRIAQK